MYYGQKTILRGLELTDVDSILADFNNLELRNYLVNSVPLSRENEFEWIKSTWQRSKQGTAYFFAITDIHGNFLGTAGLDSISPIHRFATLGIAIYKKENWNKGFGSDALKTLCWVGFNLLNLNRIELEYHAFNERGGRAYEKTGFKEIGIRRKVHFINGQYVDSVMMDILRDEFNTKFPDLNVEQKFIS